MMIDLNNVKRVHFIGIAGAGMRAIANIFIEKGYDVSGSDLKSSPTTERFEQMGATIYIGQRKENIKDAQVVIISSAIRDTNVELVEARRRGIPVIHRSDALVHIMSYGNAIAVAGAHGKTTTSSMIGQILYECQTDPTLVIGGEVDYLHCNSVLGKGRYVVVEADESDGSFLKEHSHMAVVTNIDADHMDHYGSLDNIIKAFTQFVNQVDDDGAAILCFENSHIRAMAQHVDTPFISYGIEQDAEYQAKNIHYVEGRLYYDVYHGNTKLGTLNLSVPGRHNVLNSLAAAIVALRCGVPFEGIRNALCHFHGAKRRFQTKGHVKGIWVVDDYAHHPTEIHATLMAARSMGTHKVVCLFQPHRYTRTKLLLNQFGEAFTGADTLIITDVYSAGEDPIPGVSGKLIADKVEEMTGKKVIYIPDKNDIVPYLKDHARPQDLIITMGAGDIYTIGERFVEELKETEI